MLVELLSKDFDYGVFEDLQNSTINKLIDYFNKRENKTLLELVPDDINKGVKKKWFYEVMEDRKLENEINNKDNSLDS